MSKLIEWYSCWEHFIGLNYVQILRQIFKITYNDFSSAQCFLQSQTIIENIYVQL